MSVKTELGWNGGGHIEILNTELLNPIEFTVYFKVLPKEWRNWRYFAAKATDAPFSSGWQGWRFNNNLNDAINFDIMDNTAEIYHRCWYPTNLTNGMVRDITGTYDGKTMRLYCDGELRVTYDIKVTTLANGYNIKVGACDSGTNTGTGFFNGEYFEFGMWTRALSDEEIFDLTHYHEIPEDPEMFFKFGSAYSKIYTDMTGKYKAMQVGTRQVVKKIRGMNFDTGGFNYYYGSGDSIDRTHMTQIAVGRIRTPIKGGIAATGRNGLLRTGGDIVMVWGETNGQFQTSTYDGTAWKPVSDGTPDPDKYFTVCGVSNGNELHLYVAGDGRIYTHNYRSDVIASGVPELNPPYNTTVGSSGFGYMLTGEIIAALVYNRTLTQEEIEYISDFGWKDPPRDGLVHWFIYDRTVEGEVDTSDQITGVQPTRLLNGYTPSYIIKKPLR